MLTILGGNIHFAQGGQKIGITYTNNLELENTVTATISYDPLNVTYSQELTIEDTLGSFPTSLTSSFYNFKQTEGLISSDYTSIDWIPPKPWEEPVTESIAVDTQTQLYTGIINITIPIETKAGTIIYIPYYKNADDFFSNSVSLIQVRITGLNQTGFTNDIGRSMSWWIADRNDNIPTVDGYSGWDLNWNEDTGEWQFIEIITGGGRYKETLIAIGQDDNGNGCVYFTL